jgi:DsbC/DsbD-like thiol-disulfide interchange protein
VDKVFPRFSAVFCAAIAGLLVTGGLARAQARRPGAEITPLVELSGAHPGNTLRLALKVSLAEGFHTQSNTPRDSTLIPTTLSIDAPTGVRIDELVFPQAADLKQAGLDTPLSVFEHEFAIGVQATIASSTPTGEISIPAHLRYQACDAKVCHPPSIADLQWRIVIVPWNRSVSVTEQVMEVLLGVALKTISNYLDYMSPTTIDPAFAAWR